MVSEWIIFLFIFQENRKIQPKESEKSKEEEDGAASKFSELVDLQALLIGSPRGRRLDEKTEAIQSYLVLAQTHLKAEDKIKREVLEYLERIVASKGGAHAADV